jgi:hypothetical protein
MDSISSLQSRLGERVRRSGFAVDRLLGRYRDVIWIAGDGRSGTTWLEQILNYTGNRRIVFEPFHPFRVEPMSSLRPLHYARPDSPSTELALLADRVFSGTFYHPLVDRGKVRLVHDGLLVKDIFANLFLGWADRRYPDVQKILIMRHPFAVASSKLRLQSWHWVDSATTLLEQKHLVDDYLRPHVDMISSVSDPFEMHVLLWSIMNMVPLLQLPESRLRVVTYEGLCRSPNEELKCLVDWLGWESTVLEDPKLENAISRPSRTVRTDSAIQVASDPVTSWFEHVTTDMRHRGQRILESFGLEDLYTEDGLPDPTAIKRFRMSA